MTQQIPEYRRIVLDPDGDGRLIVRYPSIVYRFLFSDGSTVDVEGHRDDSDLRGELLRVLKKEKIEGVATVSLEGAKSLVEAPVPRKRAVRKRSPDPTA